MEGKVLEVLESIEKYGVRYNGTIKVGEIIDLIEWQQAEIERLKEEKYKVEQNLKQCENGYELELHTARFDMQMNREKVAKLQKQVDELKDTLELQKTLYNRAREDGYCTGYKSAIKDTAKEILQMADEINKGGQNDLCELEVAIKERYGVEVD